MRKHWVMHLLIPLMLMGVAGCRTQHAVEVKPIHITIDINVRVDRALDDFFSDIDGTKKEMQQSADAKR